MPFSIKNGLKMALAHLHDEQMVTGWIFFVPIISLACLYGWWVAAIIWFVISNIIYVLIRCWDDPVKLGWCDK